jgi:hypothetical protein
VRKLAPRQVTDAQVPVIAFLLLLVPYGAVTFEEISLCAASDMQGCR